MTTAKPQRRARHAVAKTGFLNPKALAARVSALVNTSVDDLRSSLAHEDRPDVLVHSLRFCERMEYKTKGALLRRRLRNVCAAENTSQTIRFEDHGQDFSEWDIDARGYVIDSRVFQSDTWVGSRVTNRPLSVGGTVVIRPQGSPDRIEIKYPIEKLTSGKAVQS